jgi:hypothetical protein
VGAIYDYVLACLLFISVFDVPHLTTSDKTARMILIHFNGAGN